MVGLDFAFSCPGWYLREQKCQSASQLWALCHANGNAWLKNCPRPFWGRKGSARPAEPPTLFRQTELQVPSTAGIRPKSVFQIGGAGAVGTSSIRGMAVLHTLKRAGFSVWPFDPPCLPLLIEIYPRLLTGPVNKSSQPERQQYLQTNYPTISPGLSTTAASNEDAFDAAVSALVMATHRNQLLTLQRATHPGEELEGRIWYPCGLPAGPGSQ